MRVQLSPDENNKYDIEHDNKHHDKYDDKYDNKHRPHPSWNGM